MHPCGVFVLTVDKMKALLPIHTERSLLVNKPWIQLHSEKQRPSSCESDDGFVRDEDVECGAAVDEQLDGPIAQVV